MIEPSTEEDMLSLRGIKILIQVINSPKRIGNGASVMMCLISLTVSTALVICAKHCRIIPIYIVSSVINLKKIFVVCSVAIEKQLSSH
jgi:hypothetical protein